MSLVILSKSAGWVVSTLRLCRFLSKTNCLQMRIYGQLTCLVFLFLFKLLSHRVRSLVLACFPATVSQQWPGCSWCRTPLPGLWQTLLRVPHRHMAVLFLLAPTEVQIWFQRLFHFTHDTMVRGWHCFKWNTESSRGLMDEVQAEKSLQMNVFI